MSQKLAIHGGPKAVSSSKIGWPNFDEKAIKAVEDVLRSGKVNYWTGPKGMQFEKKFAEWQGTTTYKEKMIETPIVKASGKGWNAEAMHHADVYQIAPKKWIAVVDALGK